MSTFNTKPLEVIGGQIWIKWAPVEAFASITYGPVGNPTAAAFNAGYSWADVYHTLETCILTEESVSDVRGQGWHQEVNLFIPGDDQGTDIGFEGMVNQRWVIAVNDFHEKVRVIGSKANGCNFKIKFNSESKFSGRKGTILSFFRDDITKSKQIARTVLFP